MPAFQYSDLYVISVIYYHLIITYLLLIITDRALTEFNIESNSVSAMHEQGVPKGLRPSTTLSASEPVDDGRVDVS
jgi:hypothetical protein